MRLLWLIKMMIYVAIMTTSFDILLAWQIGGTVRFCQIVMLVPYCYFFYRCVKEKSVVVPKSIKWILIWSMFILAFVLNTNILVRSVGYWIWLMINILNIFVLVNMFKNKMQIKSLMRIYCFSFVAVSLFGIFQFVSAPFLKLSTPLVRQWWIPGVLARINGFSQEPSYFATYLLIGWCILYVLWKNNNYQLFGKFYINAFYLIVTMAMVLSSSRMGILLMLSIMFVPKLYNILKLIINDIINFRVNLQIMRNILCMFVCALFVIYVSYDSDLFDKYTFLFNGTGIGGTAAHSVDTRAENTQKTLEVFFDSPIIGASLGGVAEKIEEAENQEGNVKIHEGGAVILEVLAASGIIGVIPFLYYFYKLVVTSRKCFVTKKDEIGVALLVGLISELIILQLNQNILRPYFWMHLAILSCYLSYRDRVERE